MKELTALDMFYLLKEFEILQGAKVDQVYTPGDVIIRFHIPNQGKTHLRITPKFMFLTDFKEEQSSPGGFCMALRKWLSGARVEAISQCGFERVIRFTFKNLDMYVELFGKGNIILTNAGQVLASKNKIGKTYEPPKKEVDARKIKRSEFNTLLNSDEKIVLVLAKGLGLGGIYAKVALEGFNTQLPANSFKSKEVEKIFEAVQNLFKQKIAPSKFENHLMPFAKGEPLEEKAYNEAIANYSIIALKEEESNKKNASYLAKKKKLERILETQEESIKEQEKIAMDATRKGELIYEKYQEVKEAMLAAKKKTPNPLIKKVSGQKIHLEL